MITNWSEAPEWAHFRATDACGTTYWHELRPVFDRETGEWISEGEIRLCYAPTASLERRP